MKSLFKLIVLCLFCFTLPAQTRYFPQIADGTAGTFKYTTSFYFTNSGVDSQVGLSFRDDKGEPLEMELESLGSGSDFQIEIPSGGTVSMETTGSDQSVKVGYAYFSGPYEVAGLAVFKGIDTASGVVLFEAGVQPAGPMREFSVILDSIGYRNTGIAVVNSENSVDSENTLQFILYDQNGNELAESSLSLPVGNKIAKFVHEIFEEYDGTDPDLQNMMGSIAVLGGNNNLAGVTLRQTIPPGNFPDSVPLLTTFPVSPGVPLGSRWELVWADEFNGDSIDASKWEHQIGTGQGGWGNNERQYYTARSENSRIENGVLIIEARNQPYTPPGAVNPMTYTSARMRTINKGDWKYGRFEIRAKLPEGQGIWPAIWMLPTDEVYGGWAASGEIDIMELVGHEPDTVHGTLHYGGAWPNNKYSGKSYTLDSGKFIDQFHVFTMEWEEGEIRWYLDGNHYQTQNQWNTTGHQFPAPFDQRFHLIMNVAVGGNWPGPPDSSTVFPQRLEVDYVRVYRLKSE
jgi:beta-glucanase (GH16 family)